MDWATFVKDYGVVISTGAGLLGIVLTFIFTRSHYLRSRKWELVDREFELRKAAYNERLNEARKHVDYLHDTILHARKISSFLLEADDTNQASETISKYFDSQKTKDIHSLAENIRKKRIVLKVLDDDDLSELTTKYVEYMYPNLIYLTKAMNNLTKKNAVLNKKRLQIASNAFLQGEVTVSQMMKRLDKLAHLVPQK
jgi:hypothetical protein